MSNRLRPPSHDVGSGERKALRRHRPISNRPPLFSSFPVLDRRDRPAYPLREAARYVRVAPATLRGWVAGRESTRRGQATKLAPLIRAADPAHRVLSFNNLIEAHVLNALRVDHGVSASAVRVALRYAEEQLKVERLLLSKELHAGAGELFLERYGELVNLTKSGQIAMRRLLESYLSRIDWDDRLPIRLYPFVSGERHNARPIAIDPDVSFGRPVLVGTSVSTAVIRQRIDAGEPVPSIAADYDITVGEVEEAIVYELAS